MRRARPPRAAIAKSLRNLSFNWRPPNPAQDDDGRMRGGRRGDAEENQLDAGDHNTATPSSGKWAAISLYSHGILSLYRVAAMFARHPEWRRA